MDDTGAADLVSIHFAEACVIRGCATGGTAGPLTKLFARSIYGWDASTLRVTGIRCGGMTGDFSDAPPTAVLVGELRGEWQSTEP